MIYLIVHNIYLYINLSIINSNAFVIPLIVVLIIIVISSIFLFIRNRHLISTLLKKENQLNEKRAEIQRLLNEVTTHTNRKKELFAENESYKHILKLELDENKRLADQLKKAISRIEEADLLKSNFLANMSHEIRTPMNGIMGFAQLLRTDDLNPDKIEKYTSIIFNSSLVLINLINDISDLVKIEANQMAIEVNEFNIDDLMFEVYSIFNKLKYFQEKEHISIRLLNIDDEKVNHINTDRIRLQQVLSNLLANSLKFTDKGYIEFGYIDKPQVGNLLFFVKDSGIGIPDDKKVIIFERFRQVDEGSTRKYGGTGIGLYITKHIVNLLGGEIWVESQLDAGSTFYFTIPYSSVKESSTKNLFFKKYGDKYNWEGKTIVVAEDVETNFHFVNAVLEKTKAHVIWAKNGEEVVSICNRRDDVDIVLMDIQMPILNGYDATRKIKMQKPALPIIAQTAFAMPNDNIKCIEVGCNDYISKPINSSLLLEKLNSYLKKND